jgi:hypothetical protein
MQPGFEANRPYVYSAQVNKLVIPYLQTFMVWRLINVSDIHGYFTQHQV